MTRTLHLALLATGFLAACSAPALAGPADYLLSPIVEEGEREIELKLGHARARQGAGASEQIFSLGWGVHARWATELSVKWHREPGQAHAFDAWEWENRIQLTETGRYPVDLGLLLEVERPKDRAEGWELRWGPLLQADLTPQWQGNLNLLIEHHVRAAEASKAELGYQWQLKQRLQPHFEWGLQGFGSVGALAHWAPHDEQVHQLGPALFSRLKAGPGQTLKLNAAWLWGVTQASPRRTLRAQAELEF